jgi:hypothetical protein
VRGEIDIIQLIELPGELMSETKIKQDNSENHEINKILNCTLILYHCWTEIELIHKIIIILSLSTLVRK